MPSKQERRAGDLVEAGIKEEIAKKVIEKVGEKIAEEIAAEALRRMKGDGAKDSGVTTSLPCTATNVQTLSASSSDWQWEWEWTTAEEAAFDVSGGATAKLAADKQLDAKIAQISVSWECAGDCVPFLEMTKRQYTYTTTSARSFGGDTRTVTCTAQVTVYSGCKLPSRF
ncbi:hypothetical protein [Mesorhizobium sp. KR9-304]|uniref:hypothetical protein n=1 Tax=Mesorhizobium sp. KR9-304 TaxID=3156614 RepID=UPI0032B3A76A